MGRVGRVYFNEQVVGELTESSDGYRFTYDALWKKNGFPIGFNFPLEQDIFYSSQFFPFFENLLSEGWLRKLQSQMEHIDTTDSFGLLLANGKDLQGAFTINEE